EATGDGARLEQAAALGEAAIAHFADADGSMFHTADDAADVPVGRPRNAADNATPSGTGLIATLLARLYHLTGAPVWRSRADAVLRAFGGAGSALGAMPTLLAAADLLEDAITVVIAGDPHDPANRALLHAARVAPDPAICILHARDPANLPAQHPAHGKATGAAAAFVCRAGACSLPVGSPEALRPLLRRVPPRDARRPISAPSPGSQP
ncbi:MAG TPA: thioredoxin domain-containing protein, partial [Acetobacteraceae bacterium]|nr:thioredoxin domain-containing protein [Acetobacteraceae bacterium]